MESRMERRKNIGTLRRQVRGSPDSEQQSPTGAKTVLLAGSYAPSLVNFRGPLVSAIVQRGHRVIAVAPAIDPATADQLRVLGAEPREFEVTNQSLNPFGLLKSLREMRAMVTSVRPDVIIAYTIKPVLLGALAGKAQGIPKIVSMITGAGYAFTGGFEPKRLLSRIAATVLYRIALRRSDWVVFQNQDDEQLFRRLGLLSRRQKVCQINGSGVDLDHFSQAPQPPGLTFLMVSRLLKDKGVREYAAAATRLKAERPDVSFRLAGYIDSSPDSISESELQELITNGVEFLGDLRDIRPAIAACSVYVLPSYREGTPRSVLEAMAMGRAIITSDAPGCRETVAHGVNGFLVQPRDSEALYRAMLKFVAEPRLTARMGKESRAIAETKYDVVNVNGDLMRIAEL
jgi:glycosyltransferase involved in cell wall biosynthesis